MAWEIIWRLRRRKKSGPEEEEKKKILLEKGEEGKKAIVEMQFREEARRVTELHEQIKGIIKKKKRKIK
jgi:hypothetical protein